MKNILLLYSFVILGVASVKAQEEQSDKTERIESYKIAFITERLNLTPKEASVFWPVYNEFSDQLKKIKRAEKERFRTFKDKSQPTDAEAEKFTNDYLTYKQQELELSKKYIIEFKKVLPAPKVARLVTLEQEFKMELLHRLKDKRGR